jgi:hypothetical protein
MDKNSLDWTHKHIKITDIRMLNKLYLITINDPTKIDKENIISNPLLVKINIFEERLRSYFLKPAYQVTRKEILDATWNMYITKSYYIKIDENGMVTKYDNDPNKWYISFLEIDGELGTFSSVYRDKDLNINKK